MFLELPEKVAIVTGGARGIGFAIALRLSRAGARVVVADIDRESAISAVKRLREGGAEGRGCGGVLSGLRRCEFRDGPVL